MLFFFVFFLSLFCNLFKSQPFHAGSLLLCLIAVTSTLDQIGLLLAAFEGAELQAYVCGECSDKPTPVTPGLYSLSFQCSRKPSALLFDHIALKISFTLCTRVISNSVTFCTFNV